MFQHFFLEHYPQPAKWFERRLAYTRSVAVSSIVGYIVGLGDRHSHNILIDQQTADVIHIDLGVAFEQGKLLKTPETVPFRLTRDIVAGYAPLSNLVYFPYCRGFNAADCNTTIRMGVTGTAGAFMRCAEETLSVLRENKVRFYITYIMLCDGFWVYTDFGRLSRSHC